MFCSQLSVGRASRKSLTWEQSLIVEDMEFFFFVSQYSSCGRSFHHRRASTMQTSFSLPMHLDLIVVLMVATRKGEGAVLFLSAWGSRLCLFLLSGGSIAIASSCMKNVNNL